MVRRRRTQTLPSGKVIELETLGFKDFAQVREEACAEYKRKVKSGAIPIEEAILTCDLPIKVGAMVMLAPWVGPSKAARILRNADLPSVELGFASTDRIRALTPDERERVHGAFVTGRFQGQHSPLILVEKEKAEIRRRMANANCTLAQIKAVVG